MSSAHFIIGLFVFLILSFDSLLCSLDTNSLLDMWFTTIFFQSDLPFCPLKRIFYRENFLILMKSNLLFFLLWIVLLVSSLRTLCLALEPKGFLLCFFPKI